MRKRRYTVECVPLLTPPETFPPIEVSQCFTSIGAMNEYHRLSETFPAYHFWVRKNW